MNFKVVDIWSTTYCKYSTRKNYVFCFLDEGWARFKKGAFFGFPVDFDGSFEGLFIRRTVSQKFGGHAHIRQLFSVTLGINLIESEHFIEIIM